MSDEPTRSEFGLQVPHERLRASQIPVGTRDWMTFASFALQFDAYQALGGFDECAVLANSAVDAYHTNGSLPATISDIRTCLFFEQRRWRHFDVEPDDRTWEYINALLERLGQLVQAP